MLRAALSLLLVAGTPLLAGCKGPCRQLSEKLCECSANSTERTACLQRAASEESRIAVQAEDEVRCESLLDACDCRLVDTPEGKQRCGLSR
ncbi:MAG: hypothetical protein FJ086_03910 [Deltaproteobacteria bacterium]|nr:hypothetical protein [Deltaproteobacteria bacterium]